MDGERVVAGTGDSAGITEGADISVTGSGCFEVRVQDSVGPCEHGDVGSELAIELLA